MSISLSRPHPERAAEQPPFWLRGRVWLRRGALERMLADAADPNSTPELARRAAELTSPRHCSLLAAAIERIVETAEHPRGGLTSAVPIQRREVIAARVPLAKLAADLAGDDRSFVSRERAGLLAGPRVPIHWAT